MLNRTNAFLTQSQGYERGKVVSGMCIRQLCAQADWNGQLLFCWVFCQLANKTVTRSTFEFFYCSTDWVDVSTVGGGGDFKQNVKLTLWNLTYLRHTKWRRHFKNSSSCRSSRSFHTAYLFHSIPRSIEAQTQTRPENSKNHTPSRGL